MIKKRNLSSQTDFSIIISSVNLKIKHCSYIRISATSLFNDKEEIKIKEPIYLRPVPFDLLLLLIYKNSRGFIIHSYTVQSV